MKGKNLQPRIPGTVFIPILRRDKKIYREAKLKEFVTMKPLLQEMLKEFL